MFELERRAIFSKKWILVSHQQRFLNVGDFVRVTEAGFPLFIIRDKQGMIRCHHNVCRHRAYPVVDQESGKASILACKYHGQSRSSSPTRPKSDSIIGWSYGLDGKLAKAPKYHDIKGFERSENYLFGIHVHVDAAGFIWINLDAAPEPTVLWNDDFAGVDVQERLARFDLKEYRFDHQWRQTGNYNWKTLADNYNEVRHW